MKNNNVDACKIKLSGLVLNDVKYYPSTMGTVLIKVTNLQVRSSLESVRERNIYSGNSDYDFQEELIHFTALIGDGYLEGAGISLAGTYESYRKLSVEIEAYDSKLIDDKIAWERYEGVDSPKEEQVEAIKQVLERVNAELFMCNGLACCIYLTNKEIKHVTKLVREGRIKELMICLRCYPIYKDQEYMDNMEVPKFLRPEGTAFGRVRSIRMTEGLANAVNNDQREREPNIIDEELAWEGIETNDQPKEIVNPVISELRILNVLLGKLQKTLFWLVVIAALTLVFLRL